MGTISNYILCTLTVMSSAIPTHRDFQLYKVRFLGLYKM